MDRADYYVPKFQLLTNYEAVPSGIIGDNIASQYWQWPQITWADQPTPWVKGRSRSRDLWRGVSGRGHVMAPILAVQAASPLVYSGTEIMYSTGVF